MKTPNDAGRNCGSSDGLSDGFPVFGDFLVRENKVSQENMRTLPINGRPPLISTSNRRCRSLRCIGFVMRSMWTIKKLGYSSNPWRLVDENGHEVYEEVTMDHPDLGKSRVSMPVCGNTKQVVMDRVLDGFVKMRSVVGKRTEALRIIQAWASCDSSSPDTREKAMADIVGKCKSALS
jgi:hypothetical protein